ncbi:LLM class F420-dependent oxidoreductase [Actinomadura decatromicini]|uniref:LLM class F420-dependent oxidoreductase n=1 Tax=Actinomadura decatromicini TaxID=2604572 RepID=A0A5D3FZ86_9ACTN|nr:LLM class F420-dependent oxidoreductase [Actinomadura decatromicini]TYK53329.1 LLM class F420-dependent oxidoreductase [Actinomadura decatromicini]
MNRWGITIPLTGLPLAEHREVVAGLAGLGYTDAWSAEVAGADAFTPLALASQWGPEVRLGSAIVPVYTRGPALLAQHAATLADLAPGRFVLGIGTSSDTIVERWNGIRFEQPYQRTRDTLRFLRRALAGEKVKEEYETFAVRGFKLETPPATPPPVVLAALRPGMLRLAAREADGAITNWLAPRDVPVVRGVLGDGPELIARLFVCPTGDAAEARAIGRWMIAAYLTVPVYRAFHEWLGRGEALRPMHEAWAAGDRKAALAAIPDEVVDDLLVHGTPAECRARVREYGANGLTTPVLAVVPGGGLSPAEAVRALAPDAD